MWRQPTSRPQGDVNKMEVDLGLLVLRATIGLLFAGHGLSILGAVAATWLPGPAPRRQATAARSA